MRIREIELYEMRLPLAVPFIISGGIIRERRSVVVVLHDEDGHVGYGESALNEEPFYSDETLAGARDLLVRVLLPRLAGRQFESPEAVDATLQAGIRGNPFARAAAETAAWDLEAARRGIGLSALLAERLNVSATKSVPCGLAFGIPPDGQIATLQQNIRAALKDGVSRVKIKIAPGWDEAPVRAAAEVLAGTGIALNVDANGAYEWPEHEAVLRSLDKLGLQYIEQPLPPSELLGHIHLSRTLSTPICVDETLHDARAARQIAELGGPKVWNMKVHRVGGLTELCRIYRVAVEYGAKLWAGTMPESGLGSQSIIAAAALPAFVYPSDLQQSVQWFGEHSDVIELVTDSRSHIAVPDVSIAGLINLEQLQMVAQRIL